MLSKTFYTLIGVIVAAIINIFLKKRQENKNTIITYKALLSQIETYKNLEKLLYNDFYSRINRMKVKRQKILENFDKDKKKIKLKDIQKNFSGDEIVINLISKLSYRQNYNWNYWIKNNMIESYKLEYLDKYSNLLYKKFFLIKARFDFDKDIINNFILLSKTSEVSTLINLTHLFEQNLIEIQIFIKNSKDFEFFKASIPDPDFFQSNTLTLKRKLITLEKSVNNKFKLFKKKRRFTNLWLIL